MSESKGLQINWLGASGSALGAVTSAVLLSTLGAAGTLIGAALGSLIITVGGAVYSYSLERAKTGLEKTAVKVKYTGRGNKSVGKNNAPISATSDRQNVDDPTETVSMEAGGEEPEATEKPRWQQTLRGLPWKRIGLLAGGLFVVTMAIILVFELSTGRPVSSYTGGSSSDTTGTTFSGLTGRSGGTQDEEGPGNQTPNNDNPEQGPADQYNNPQQGEQGNDDVDQDQQQPNEVPDNQNEPAPEPEQEQPQQQNTPQPQQPEQPAPQQEAPEQAPAE